MAYKEQIFKTLTRNDTGETHSHQSGITIPKRVAISSIFPKLGLDTLNPRIDITFFDEDNRRWTFQYIYYNDLYFGKPKNKAHDEHRMTCVKDFIERYRICSGDEIWFGLDDRGVRRIGFVKAKDKSNPKIIKVAPGFTVLKLGTNWRSVHM